VQRGYHGLKNCYLQPRVGLYRAVKALLYCHVMQQADLDDAKTATASHPHRLGMALHCVTWHGASIKKDISLLNDILYHHIYDSYSRILLLLYLYFIILLLEEDVGVRSQTGRFLVMSVSH
jgi:hypothetical protein